MRKLLLLLTLLVGILGGLLYQQDLKQPVSAPVNVPDTEQIVPLSTPSRTLEPVRSQPPSRPTPIAVLQTPLTSSSLPNRASPKQIISERFEMKQVRDSFVFWRPKENILAVYFFDETLPAADREAVTRKGSSIESLSILPRMEFIFHLRAGTSVLSAAALDGLDVSYLWRATGSTYRRLRQTILPRNGMNPAADELSGKLGDRSIVSGRSAFSMQVPTSAGGEQAVRLSWDIKFNQELLLVDGPKDQKKQQAAGRGIIRLRGEELSIKSALMFWYPAGQSLAVGLFDETLSQEERAAFLQRRSLLNSGAQKVPVLVFVLQLQTNEEGRLSCGDLKSYTVYWPNEIGLKKFAGNESLQRLQADFEEGEWRDCSGELAEGAVAAIATSGQNLAIRAEQRVSWAFSLREPISVMR